MLHACHTALANYKVESEAYQAFKESVAKKSEELKNWFSHLGKGE